MMFTPEFEQFLAAIDRAVGKPLRGVQRHDLRVSTSRIGGSRPVDHLGYLLAEDCASILLSIGAGDRNPVQVPGASYVGAVFSPQEHKISSLDWRFSPKVEPAGPQVLRALERISAEHGVRHVVTAPLLTDAKVALAEKLGYRKHAVGSIYVKDF